jgi:hypothetical protein
LTKSGASGATIGGIVVLLVTSPGTLTSCRLAEGGVDRGEVHLHDLLALLAVGLLDRVLDRGDRLVRGKHAAGARRSRSA